MRLVTKKLNTHSRGCFSITSIVDIADQIEWKVYRPVRDMADNIFESSWYVEEVMNAIGVNPLSRTYV